MDQTSWSKLKRERARDAVLTPSNANMPFSTRCPSRRTCSTSTAPICVPVTGSTSQVLESGFGPFADLPTVVATVGRYYLLPAVAVARLEDANVVVSWEADPGLLGVEFEEQHRAGLQLFFVSRVAR